MNRMTNKKSILFVSLLLSAMTWADDTQNNQPITQQEREQGRQLMVKKLHDRIEVFGNNLKSDDFELGWRGRQLNKQKRQEVCGIYQSVIQDMYNLAQENRGRLSEEDKKIVDNRDAFIQALGFKNNSVDTQMGFNCRLK